MAAGDGHVVGMQVGVRIDEGLLDCLRRKALRLMRRLENVGDLELVPHVADHGEIVRSAEAGAGSVLAVLVAGETLGRIEAAGRGEIGFRANGLAYIPRRYCVARALMDDPRAPTDDRMRRKRTAVYSIAADAGIIGLGWGVEWCVVGLDRNHAYAPDCDVLRPIIERWIGQYKWLADYGLKARY